MEEIQLKTEVEAIPSASYSKCMSLTNLRSTLDQDKVENIVAKIKEVINTSVEEGSFSCFVSNDMLEDLFTDNEEAFDDSLIQYVVNYLKYLGYKVKYDELIYGDLGNIIEISW